VNGWQGQKCLTFEVTKGQSYETCYMLFIVVIYFYLKIEIFAIKKNNEYKEVKKHI